MVDPVPFEARGRVFLVVVDDSPELRVALRYASLRARRTGGRVALLYVMDPPDRQHWMALESLMREEKREEAEELVGRHADTVAALTGSPPVIHIREGVPHEQLLALIDEDPTISVLVLAAAVSDSGPGPLISALSNKLVGRLRVPLTIVPGSLSDTQIDSLT
ncbi:universal stress protein [Aliidongia dinghuensis]|uniref:Universal stress protein n=1 Tax=Aliidongia dinghuensis TaxID=1867774 RepID=A0A8J3E2M7_9PROT|nr:universal stress protein [Aliidongia dinghuensis]GGE99858.1 universal stress protein [Aliidongia dinghuensis]